MPEEKRKLNAWIPVSLYSKLESAGYDNVTQALIKALEKFFEDPQEDITGYQKDIEGYKQDIEGSKKDLERIQEGYKQDITGYKENIKSLNSEIERLQAVIMDAPDPLELAEMKGSYTGLEKVIQEKDKRIEALEREVSRLDMFAHYFKSVDVKQIEVPAAQKKKPWWKLWG